MNLRYQIICRTAIEDFIDNFIGVDTENVLQYLKANAMLCKAVDVIIATIKVPLSADREGLF